MNTPSIRAALHIVKYQGRCSFILPCPCIFNSGNCAYSEVLTMATTYLKSIDLEDYAYDALEVLL